MAAHAPESSFGPLVACIALAAVLGSSCRAAPTGETTTPGGDTRVRSSRGLSTAWLDVPGGEVGVLLPGDMAAGDTVSGRVSVPPPGESRSVFAGPHLPFADHVLEVGAQRFRVGHDELVVDVPRDAKSLRVALLDPSGALLAETAMPVAPAPAARAAPGPPAWLQAGGLASLEGRFDGDLRTTNVTVGGEPFVTWTESPRRVIGNVPRAPRGRTELVVRDAEWSIRRDVQLLGVSTTPRRVAVQRGDEVSVTTTVDGLEDAPPELRPTLVLTSWTEGETARRARTPIDPTRATSGRVATSEKVVAGGAGTLRTIARLHDPVTAPAP